MTVWVVALLGHTKATEQAVSVFLFAIAPVIAAGIVAWTLPRAALGAPIAVGKIFIAVVLLAVSTIVTVQSEHLWSLSAPRVMSVAFLEAMVLAAPFMLVFRFRTALRPVAVFADFVLAAGLAAALILFSPLNAAQPFVSTMVGYMRDTPDFSLWALGGAVYVAAALLLGAWEERHAGKPAVWVARFALALGLVLALSLYDDGHWTDFPHYAPLVGAALYAGHGGVPMVDVYCQYGLAPWLLVRALFAVLEPTVGSAAIVVRILNVAFLMSFVLIAFLVAKRKARAVMLMMPVLLAAIAFHENHWNLNGLPSVQGMRYLPPVAMALLLVLDAGKPVIRRLVTLALVAASFWSIESFLFTLLVWGGRGTIEAIRERRARPFALSAAANVGWILGAHFAFALAVFGFTGRMVDYRPYADLFVGFVLGRGSWPWPMAMKGEFLWWLPIWLAYFLTLALSLLGAVRQAQAGTADRLLGVALAGIAALSYYVGRSTETNLGITFLPFGVLLVCAFEQVMENRPGGPPRYAIAGLMAAVLVLVFAFGMERLSRPLDALKGNSTVLRRCFSPEGCAPAQVAGRIRAATEMVVDYRARPAPGLAQTPLRVADLVRLLRAHAPTAPRVSLLTELDVYPRLNWVNGMLAFLQTGQWYSWPTSSPLNDQLSPLLARRIVAAAAVHDGEPLIVARPETRLLGIERDILAKIRTACRLEKIEETGYFSVYRVAACRPPGQANAP